MNSRVVRLGSLVALWLLSATAARASTITFSFTGSVTSVDSSLATAFSPGDALTGTFIFDSDAAPFPVPAAFIRQYFAPTQLLSATVGSYIFSGSIVESLEDLPADIPPPSTDRYAVIAASHPGGPPEGCGPCPPPSVISGPSVNGLPLWFFNIVLTDPSGSALSSLALVPPVFSNYSDRQFSLVFGSSRPDDAHGVFGTVSSLAVVTPSAIPEPTSFVLLASGMFGPSARRWLRRNLIHA
jgi:hypothetical protein